jgi:hypothetical protein
LKGRDYFGDLDIDGRIILKWALERYGVDWIELAQSRP